MQTRISDRDPVRHPHIAALATVLRHHGKATDLSRMMGETGAARLPEQLPAEVAIAGLRREMDARLYTWNLDLFDPLWFAEGLTDGIINELEWCEDEPVAASILERYLAVLELGGTIDCTDPTPAMLLQHTGRGLMPIAWTHGDYLSMTHRGLHADVVLVHGFDDSSREVVLSAAAAGPVPCFRVPFSRFATAMLLSDVRSMLVLSPARW